LKSVKKPDAVAPKVQSDEKGQETWLKDTAIVLGIAAG
jgi:hypothetical protein